MATTLAPFGLKPIRNLGANAPTYSANKYYIKKGYASKIGWGDLVITGSSGNLGYVTPYAAGGSLVLGVFAGCMPYFDTTLNQYINKPWWAGTENASDDVEVMVYDDPALVFLAQVSGGPVTRADRGKNIDVTGNGAPNTSTGISTTAADYTTIATTNTLPLRIIGIATYAYQNIDPTAPYSANAANNLVEVSLNTAEIRTLTGI